MSDFKAKMHQIRFQMAPQTLLRELQPSPDTLTRFKWPTSKGREGREWKRDGRGKEKEEEGWREGRGSPPPPTPNSWIRHWDKAYRDSNELGGY